MPKILKFRRGTTAELSQITGGEGEVFVNLDTKQIHIHDGVKQGGYPLATTINPVFEGGIIADSALIGDVSIVGDTISALDSYGLPSVLTVDGGMKVSVGEDVIINLTEIIPNTSFFFHPSPTIGGVTFSGLSADQHNKFNNLQAGDKVSFAVNYNGQQYNGKFVFQSIYEDFDSTQVTFQSCTFSNWSEAGDLTQIIGQWHYESNVEVYLGNSKTQVLSSLINVVDVNLNGVGIIGDLSVSGKLISDAALTLNQDGSKSIVVDTTEQVVNLLDLSSANPQWSIDMNNPSQSNFIVFNNAFTGAEHFVKGAVVTAWSDSAGNKGTEQYTFTLLTDLVYNSNYNQYRARTVETAPSMSTQLYGSEFITTLSTGSEAFYSFDDQGTFTSTSLVADSALIGDLSIIDNHVAIQDSYGLPGTLNVSASGLVFDSNLDLTIDSVKTTTDTVTDPQTMNQFTATSSMMGNPKFTYSPMSGSSWSDASKFVTGSIVSITDQMYGNKVIRLTSDMTYDNMFNRWEAGYTTIGGSSDTGSDFRSYSVTVTNITGDVANYSFDDQGVFTAPVLSTSELLIDGSPAGLLTVNEDASKSLVIDSFTSKTETVTATMANQFSLGMLGFTYNGDSSWPDASKFVIGSVVSITSMAQTSVVRLTSNMIYTGMANNWVASVTVISGPSQTSSGSGSVIVTNQLGKVTNYDFTESGFIADAALIGNVSIIDNQIAVEDSYGIPGTLNVSASGLVFDSNLDLSVNSVVSTTEIVNGGMNQFRLESSYFSYDPMGSTPSFVSKFVVGTIVSLTESMSQTTTVFRLTSDFTYTSPLGYRATYQIISGSVGAGRYATNVTVTNSTGSEANYGFDDQGTFTSTSLVADSALIGDVSIIGNQIAVEDSYGLPGTLNVSASEVTVGSNLNLNVDTVITATETITDPSNMNQFTVRSAMMGSAQFTYSPMSGSSWTDASKFKVGTIVSVTDSMYGTVVIRLTSDMTFDNNMDMRWEANYELISGSVMSDVRSFSVIINNESGSVANYSFDDQGVLTAPTVSTDSLLIGGSPAAFITTNPNGSKSVDVDSTLTETITLDMSGYGTISWLLDNNSGKYYFFIPDSLYLQYGQYFNNGTIVAGFFDAAGKAGPFTLTLASAMTSRMISANQGYAAETVETPPGFPPSSTNNIWPNEVTVTNTTGGVVTYNFGNDGSFTTSSIIAETALIGDVSVISNTVTAIDSYGNPGTLVVDGSLDVKNVSTVSTDYAYGSPPSAGQWDGMLYWSGTSLTWNNPSATTLDLIASLKAGDTITFEDSMSVGTYVTVTLTSTMTYSMGAMAYLASVVENNSGMSIGSSNITITITTLITKISSFDSTGLVVGGNVEVTGQLVLADTTEVPVNTSNPVKYAKVIIAGQQYFMPLYQ